MLRLFPACHTPQPLIATEGDNTANILVSDLVACNGLLHITDAVLIPPTLTTFQQARAAVACGPAGSVLLPKLTLRLQISLRPELSLYKRLLLSPGLESVRRSLGIEGAAWQRAPGSFCVNSALDDLSPVA